MKKYTQVMKMNFQIELSYKWNFILTSLMDIFRVVAEIALWKILLDATSSNTISGYNLNSIITYYIFIFVIGTVTDTSHIGRKIANDIKEGVLNNLIIRPVNYIGYYFSETLSQKFVRLLIAIITFIPMFIIQASNICISINSLQLLLFPLVLLLSLVINFFLNVVISLLVFWITEVTSLFFFKDILLDFLSGRIFPIDLLPIWIFNAFQALPFMYCTFFPINVLTKGMVDGAFFKGILMQIIWVAILYLIIKLLWKFGIKKYAGTGA